MTNVGEIHIEGVAYDFSGNMIIKRDGYKSSSLSIEPGKEKLYLHADLSQSNNPQIKNKIPKNENNKIIGGKITEIFLKIDKSVG